MLKEGSSLRALIERLTGFSLGNSQDMREQWTVRTFAEQSDQLKEQLTRPGIVGRDVTDLGSLPCAVSYDGQTRVHEVTAILIRFVDDREAEWKIKVKVLDLLVLRAQQNAENMAILIERAVEDFVPRRCVVAVQRDGASVNELVNYCSTCSQWQMFSKMTLFPMPPPLHYFQFRCIKSSRATCPMPATTLACRTACPWWRSASCCPR